MERIKFVSKDVTGKFSNFAKATKSKFSTAIGNSKTSEGETPEGSQSELVTTPVKSLTDYETDACGSSEVSSIDSLKRNLESNNKINNSGDTKISKPCIESIEIVHSFESENQQSSPNSGDAGFEIIPNSIEVMAEITNDKSPTLPSRKNIHSNETSNSMISALHRITGASIDVTGRINNIAKETISKLTINARNSNEQFPHEENILSEQSKSLPQSQSQSPGKNIQARTSINKSNHISIAMNRTESPTSTSTSPIDNLSPPILNRRISELEFESNDGCEGSIKLYDQETEDYINRATHFPTTTTTTTTTRSNHITSDVMNINRVVSPEVDGRNTTVSILKSKVWLPKQLKHNNQQDTTTSTTRYSTSSTQPGPTSTSSVSLPVIPCDDEDFYV